MKNTGYKKNTIHTRESCRKSMLAIRDTLDVVGGKWKLVLITILLSGKRRFSGVVKGSGYYTTYLVKRTSGNGNERSGNPYGSQHQTNHSRVCPYAL